MNKLPTIFKKHFYNPGIFPISDKRGVGERFTLDGEEFEICPDTHFIFPEYRLAFFKITTYKGSGGMHYYGELFVHTRNNSTTVPGHTVGGYLGEYTVPKDAQTLHIPLLRPVNSSERAMYPKRWEDYPVGALTNAFNTEAEIIHLFKKFSNKLFTGKWCIKCEYIKTGDVILIDNKI